VETLSAVSRVSRACTTFEQDSEFHKRATNEHDVLCMKCGQWHQSQLPVALLRRSFILDVSLLPPSRSCLEAFQAL
jgi:hypothetical protein